MEEKLTIQDKSIYAHFSQIIPVTLEVAWEGLLDTTQWFPQIKVGDLSLTGYMTFTMPETIIRMPILEYEPYRVLSYEWSTGRVRFELVPVAGGTRLDFLDVLPQSFPHRARDITGWSITLKRLRASLLGEKLDYDMKENEIKQKEYQKQIDALVQK